MRLKTGRFSRFMHTRLIGEKFAWPTSPSTCGAQPAGALWLQQNRANCAPLVIDGNGRTGRALLHRILRREGVLSHATLPISAGLLHDVDGYMSAIRSYQEGDLLPIIESVTGVLELSLVVGRRVAERIDDVMDGWRSSISERAGSAIWRLPALLAEQPVVTVAYVAENLGITSRAASTLVQRACGYGMLRPLGSRRRGDYYQSDELIAVLEDISSSAGIRRVLAG